ncbi:unnamed protein product [Meloidogyne enterolobii]|uniref:Uncharacterized protein n=1 Tax=Meloidogyne enterolobii TaxID=390850 RepID=A0ACB1B7B7_MELEN
MIRFSYLWIITFNFLKIILLRYAYAPLLIFEFALGTLISSNEEYKAQYVGFSSFLCLPLEERFEIPKNSFLTKEVVEKVTIKLVRFLGNLELNKEEFVLFKLFFTFGLYSVVLNDVEREKLSDNGEIFVEKFYDCAINLMHNYSSTKALKFFTKFQPELLVLLFL